jgi:AcrR family transcriptional regulator
MTKKQLLMLTARRLFAEKGFYGTPTAKIAEIAGVSNGILFHYFPSKDILIKALYQDIKERLFNYALTQIYHGATLKESIYTLWLASVEWNLENPEDFEFMLQFENSPYYSVEIEKSHRYVQMNLELIEQGLEQGIFKHFSALFVVRILASLVETTVKYLRQNQNLIDDFEYKNRLFELAWDAISKR